MNKIKGFLPFYILIFTQMAAATALMVLLQFSLFQIHPETGASLNIYLFHLLLLLPFVLVLTPAGHFSDKYPKERVILVSLLFSFLISILASFSFFYGNLRLAYIATILFFMASAFFSPAKFGFLKELVGVRYLSSGVTLFMVFSVLSIALSALFVGNSYSYFVPEDLQSASLILKAAFPISLSVVLFSAIALFFSRFLPEIGSHAVDLKFPWKRYFNTSYSRRKTQKVWRNLALRQSIIGLSMFWLIVLLLVFIFQEQLQPSTFNLSSIFQMGIFYAVLGLIAGCIYAGKMSKAFIETGLVPLGTAGVSISIFLISVLPSPYSFTLYFALGFFGGVFVIPMTSILLYNSKPRSAGHVVSINNAIQHIVMLAFFGLSLLLVNTFSLSLNKLFFFLGILCLFGTIWAILALPHSLLRQILRGVFSVRYKMSVKGVHHIPWEGPVLLVGNHISFLDWAFLQMASPRPLRFVIRRQSFEKWYIRLILKQMNVIELDFRKPEEAMALANEALKKKEAVVLFPEIAISRTGNVNRFRLDYSLALKDLSNIKVLPFYIQGLWGSSYSMSSAGYREKIHKAGERSVSVAFGELLEAETPIIEVKNKVQELSITAWEAYIQKLRPMASSWLRSAKRVGSAPSVFSPDGNHFSGTSMSAAVLSFGKIIESKTQNENHVGILIPPSAPCLIANLACLIKGKTVINLNYTSPVSIMQYCADEANVKTIFTARAFVQKLTERGLDLSPLLNSYQIYYMEDLKEEISKFTLIRNFIRSKLLPVWWIEHFDVKKVSLNDVASILFSSGSEGKPKGVELTHFNLMGNIKQCMSVLNPGSDDVLLGILPLFHAFGFSITSMMCLVEGVPVVAYPDPTDSKMIGRICAEFKVTIIVGTGTFLRMWGTSRSVHPLMFESIRAVWAGAEKIREDVRILYRTKFQKEIYEGFGTTETTPVAAVNTFDTLLEDYQTVQQGNKPGTVGAPLPGTQFKIVDPENMEELPIGEDGLILIGGAQIMRGYLNDPDRTAQVIAVIDGKRWYKTGDKGHVDEDGFLTIVDRYSRFAKLGGEMVSLGAIELKISESMVLDGTDFCTVAVPDKIKGEKVALLFSSEDLDEAQVKEKIRQIKLSPLMQPGLYLKLEELPKLGSGKSDYVKSKQIAMNLLK